MGTTFILHVPVLATGFHFNIALHFICLADICAKYFSLPSCITFLSISGYQFRQHIIPSNSLAGCFLKKKSHANKNSIDLNTCGVDTSLFEWK
jgi:hypothetical protein